MGRSRQRKRERRPPVATGGPVAVPRPRRAAPARAVDVTALAWGALLVALTALAYGPALRAGFIWDDNLWITGNAALRSTDGLRRIWLEPLSAPQYYPLALTSFWVEYQLFGPDPRVFHAVNILLHGLSAVVLWRLLVRLTLPGAWLAAAAFALHPVHVESVAWVTERKNVLSGLCYLLAFRVFVDVLLPDSRSRQVRWLLWAGGTALFVAALLSKTVTATLPAALLLVVWWKRKLTARDVLRVAPLLALGAAAGLGTAWLERGHVGASGPDFALSFVQRVLIAGRALWFYLGTLAWPAPLTFVYPRWHVDPAVWWQWTFPLAALAAVAGLWAARGRLGRGPLVAALFFAGTLFPALGFVNVYPMLFSFVADHFQYLASIGPIAALVAVATTRLRLPAPGRTAAAAAVLAVLGLLTWRQTRIYESLETLYRDTLAKNPAAWMAHNNLGRILDARGDAAGARYHFEETLRLHPGYAEGHNNLGVALEHLGNPEEALANYEEAIRLLPDYADAQYNLARLLAQRGRGDEAIPHYERTLAVRPDFPPARSNLGRLLYERGRLDDAETQLRESLRLRPGHPETLLTLGQVLEARGDVAGARDAYAAALRARPGWAEAEARLAGLRGAGS
jgi:tetratricopeptide (TPR) repeat protein